MPLYEYLCHKCQRRFEVIQRMADDPLETCTECGGKLEKLFSAPAIQFKGAGWYVTDYAKKSGSSPDTKSGTPSSGSSSSGSTGGGSGDSSSSSSPSSTSSSSSSPSSSDSSSSGTKKGSTD